jgi:hypothetical protein
VIRFRFVQDNQSDLPVTPVCDLVEMPRSWFSRGRHSIYTWLNFAFVAGNADLKLSFDWTKVWPDKRSITQPRRLPGPCEKSSQPVSRIRSGSPPKPKPTSCCSSSSRCSATGNAINKGSVISTQPKTQTKAPENCPNPVSKKRGQDHRQRTASSSVVGSPASRPMQYFE